MLCFENIKGRESVDGLKKLGFSHGDDVIAIFDGGEVLFGQLHFIEEYKTMFDVELVLDHTYWKTRAIYGAFGILRVDFV